jgi:hypothetical protein
MRHLVAQHRGQFGGVAGQRDQAARHIKLAGRQRERIHRAGIEDRDLVGLVGTLGSRHQPVDGLADQGFQLRIVIGAAIGGQDALVFFFGGRLCANVRLGLAGLAAVGEDGWNRLISPQAASAKRIAGPAQPKGGGSSCSCAVPHVPSTSATRFPSGELIPAEQLNLSHPEHLYSRPGTRLDKPRTRIRRFPVT